MIYHQLFISRVMGTRKNRVFRGIEKFLNETGRLA